MRGARDPVRVKAAGRALLLALLALALALPLNGCGKEDLSLETVATAADATSRSGSFRMTMDMRFESPSVGTMKIDGHGEYDIRRGRARLIQDFGSIAEQFGEDGDGAEMEFLFADSAMYLRAPEALGEEQLADMDGKRWLKFDLRKAGREAGVDVSQLMQQMNNSPERMLDQLRAVSGELEKLGSEEVRGVETTRYRTTVDVRKLPEVVPAKLRPLMRKATKEMVDGLGGPTYPIELWIGEDDLVRRERHFMTIREDGERVKATMTMEMFDFGARVEVEPPPDKDVHDATDEIPAGGGLTP